MRAGFEPEFDDRSAASTEQRPLRPTRPMATSSAMLLNSETQSAADRYFRRPVHCLLGLPLDALRLADVIELVRDANRNERRLVLLTPNTNDIVQSLSNRLFRDAFLTSDVSVADGMPVVWLGRFLGLPIPERIAGADVFDGLREGLGGTMSVFFFGGADGVADMARQKINLAHCSLRCVGAVSPGFGALEALSDDGYIDEINRASPDLLVLSLGKHGKPWVLANAHRIHRGVISHLGAVVNFAAERIRRAPKRVQLLGFEWMWRILQEPALFERYFRDARTLSRLFFERVLPLRIEQLRYAASRSRHNAPELRVIYRESAYLLQLSGAWTESRLDPLRDLLVQACELQADLLFDLRAVTYIDSACVGAIGAAYGWQLRNKRRFAISERSAIATRILRLHCCDYLLE